MRWLSAIFLLLCVASCWPGTDIAVIVNNNSDLGNLSLKNVQDIFTGELVILPNHEIPIPLDERSNLSLRSAYYEALTGKSLPLINEHWARLLFSGKVTPPALLLDEMAMLRAVRSNRDALGYLTLSKVPEDVHVVLTLHAP